MKNLDLLASLATQQAPAGPQDYWTWGTMQARVDNRTTVLLDGDTDPISAGVIDMVGAEKFPGQRVRCQVQGNRVYVTGMVGGRKPLSGNDGEMEEFASWPLAVGETFYNSQLHELWIWTGSEWAELVKAAKPAGRIVGTGGTPEPVPNGSWTEMAPLMNASGSGARLNNGMIHQNGRLQVPRAGWYQVSGTLTLAPNASNRRGIGLDRASSTGAAFENRWYSLIGAPPSGSATISHAIPLYCEANDYIRIWAYQNSGGGLNINYSAAQLQLSAVFLTE